MMTRMNKGQVQVSGAQGLCQLVIAVNAFKFDFFTKGLPDVFL